MTGELITTPFGFASTAAEVAAGVAAYAVDEAEADRLWDLSLALI